MLVAVYFSAGLAGTLGRIRVGLLQLVWALVHAALLSAHGKSPFRTLIHAYLTVRQKFIVVLALFLAQVHRPCYT